MAKSKYTEQLAEWVEKRAEKKRRQDAAIVAFLAIKPDVMDAIDSGYALSTIWEHLYEIGKVKCSYETFRKHVHRFISKVKPVLEEMTPQLVNETSKTSSVTNKQSKPIKQPGFKFDAIPKKEELL